MSQEIRVANCCCGEVTVTTTGAPVRVSICHCFECQRRTGSVFAAQARFDVANVSVAGKTQEFVRVGDSGSTIRFHFCPKCGSTVFYHLDDDPGVIAVAVGAFADAAFVAPSVSVYEDRRHAWVQLPDDITHIA